MSLQRDIQQKVMDILADQVADAELGTIPTFLEYLNPTQETEKSRIQSFDPSLAVTEGSFGQRLSTLTFTLQYKRAVGDSTAVNASNVVERFATAMRLDPTLGGLVLQCSVSTRSSDVRNEQSEPLLGTMSITATIDDGDINQPQTGANITRTKINYVDIDGKASSVSELSPAGVTVTDSTEIPGALSLSFDGVGNFPSFEVADPAFAEFPIDVSVGTTNRIWRFLYYVKPSLFIFGTNVTFHSSASPGNDSVTYANNTFSGWNEFVVDLDETPNTTGGTFDPTNLIRLKFAVNVFNTVLTDAFLLKRIFQYPRDRGTSGISPGF